MIHNQIIHDAALSIYYDFRRSCARAVSERISGHVRTLIGGYQEIFDTNHASVSGSTYRNTHLPDSPDFDIGLMPSSGSAKYEDSFSSFVLELGRMLRDDKDVCACLSFLYRVESDKIKTSFNDISEWKDWKGGQLRTAKFKINDQSVLEVSAGRHRWNRIGLCYNSEWDNQIAKLDNRAEVMTVSQICLIKLLATKYRCYKQKYGGLSSRGIEQLIMVESLRGSKTPLVDAMGKISKLDDPRRMILNIPVPPSIFEEVGLSEARRNAMRTFRGDGWRRFQLLADELLTEPLRVLERCL